MSRQPHERCETCRFWDEPTTECHRHAPVMLTLERSPAAGRNGAPAELAAPMRAWPRTQASEWCGEWSSTGAATPPQVESRPVAQEIATLTFIHRLSPTFNVADSAGLLEALLNQLPPDIRRVIVRMNGLDGQPLSGLKEVAREFKMSRDQVRTLLAAGEKRLTEMVAKLAPPPRDKQAT